MSYLMNTYNRFPLTIQKGNGVYLYDNEGKRYLDFVAGIATNTLGYSNKEYQEALIAQLTDVMHVSNLYTTTINEQAAEKLVSMTDFDQVFFVNSGTEAIEASLKLARIYAKKTLGKDKFEVISMKNGFHGRTMGSLSLTGQSKYQDDFTPLLPGVQYAVFNDISSLQAKITDNTCAVILEIIQGEGGIINAEASYLEQVNTFCKDNKLLLILDEVQTGVGRTGTFFAYEQFNIQPDIVATAKGLGGGFPVGAVLATNDVANAFTFGKHGTTFGGNPLASRAVYTVLTILQSNKLLEHVTAISNYLRTQLETLQQEYSCIKRIKGMGLMLGIELIGLDKNRVIETCMKHGLLLVGASETTIRLVPPLIIERIDVDHAIRILTTSLNEVIG